MHPFCSNVVQEIPERELRAWFLRELMEDGVEKKNYQTLRMLIILLSNINANSKLNGIDCHILGYVFGPLLMGPKVIETATKKQIVTTLIEDCNDIFVI
jgi:hypothetical protein